MSNSNSETELSDAIIGLIIIGPMILFEGWVMLVLYRWFIMPFGLPNIGLFHAIGISTLISTIKGNRTSKENKEVSYIYRAGVRFFTLLFLLGLGYISHRIMVG
jgi:hypothetical protein